jgi:hypothetical protein
MGLVLNTCTIHEGFSVGPSGKGEEREQLGSEVAFGSAGTDAEGLGADVCRGVGCRARFARLENLLPAVRLISLGFLMTPRGFLKIFR